jgi:polysaccharide pyruvyl transferase WcaK-like protein
MPLKILYAPDTSDHPNWGCRFMGDWYRHELARTGAVVQKRVGSRWFFSPAPGLPDSLNWSAIRQVAGQVRAGTLLQPVAKSLLECDVLFVNAENFVRPGVRKGRMLLLLAYLAKHVFGKRCILTNATFDFSEPELREIARNVLPMLDHVHVREESSLAGFRALLPGAPVSRFADVAWTFRPQPVSAWGEAARRTGQLSAWPDVVDGFDPFQPYITVCASSWFAMPEQASVDPTAAFMALCARLQALVPQVLLVASCEVDAKIMRRVAAAARLPLLGLTLPVPQGADVLANATLHVGGRWHPGIFASTGGTPLLAFTANTHKMHALVQQLQPEMPVFDAGRIEADIDAIIACASRQLDAGSGLREQLRRRAAMLAQSVEGNLADLHAMVRQTAERQNLQ